MLTVQAEAVWGENIKNSLREARALSEKIGCGVRLKFNEIQMMVYSDDNINELYEEYRRLLKEGMEKCVQEAK